MATVQAYTSRGYSYYRLVTSRRGPDGRPRLVVLRHLGTAQDLGEALLKGRPAAKESLVVEFGGSAAVLAVARELGFVAIVDRHAPKRDQGPSVGQYMLLAAINRVVAPRSKRKMRSWYRATALPRLLGISPQALSSQRFWDHMGYLTQDRLGRIQEDLVKAVLDRYSLDVRTLFYDGTNFDTFMDSVTMSELARRGHAKSKRTDLRIVSLGLLVSADFHVPLLWDIYPGNRPDSVELRGLIDRLVQRYRLLAEHCEDVTLVFDKGNNAEDNLQAVADSPYHVVGSFVPSHHSDLLAVPLSKFEALDDARLKGVLAYRTRKEVFKRTWGIVVTRSEGLLRGQLRGIAQHLRKRRRQLRDLQRAVWRWHEREETGKGYTQESLKARIGKILAGGQYVSRLLKVHVRVRRGRLEIRYETDQTELGRLTRDVLGKRILFTDQESWTTEEIILAYRGQRHVERAFRDMKDPVFMTWRPLFHWTDDKIRVHALYCLSALTLASLLHRKVMRGGMKVSLQEMLRGLTRIQEVYGLASRRKGGESRGRRRAQISYTRLDAQQERMVELLDLRAMQGSSYIQATK
ncbi:MAG: IS1634 family transposase [Planctomycetota bacterium]|nr:IS1634 family transposase [Planctomycetota bacterium]